MTAAATIILCQPSGRLGCSVCCGLFNLTDCSRQTLTSFLAEGRRRSEGIFSANTAADVEIADPDRVRDMTTHICPHQGFLSEGKPGCLIHPLSAPVSRRDEAFFGERICDRFLCPAHDLLDDEHKRVLMRYVTDWYRYAAAIIDPIACLWIIDTVSVMLRGQADEDLFIRLLNEGLEKRASQLVSTFGPIFQYSVSEYRLAIQKRNPLEAQQQLSEIADHLAQFMQSLTDSRGS